METYKTMENDKLKNELILLCRTCLKKLKTPKYDIYKMSYLSRLLSMFTSLEITDNDILPKHLCNECFEKIGDFYKFRTMCIESVKKFYQIYNILKNENTKEQLLELGIKEIDKEEKFLLNTVCNYEEEIHEYEQFEEQNEQKYEKDQISCSKIEEEVVNVLANMVQIPNSPRQLQLQLEEEQQELDHNQQSQKESEDDIEPEEKVLQAQLEALCEDEYSIEEVDVDTVNRLNCEEKFEISDANANANENENKNDNIYEKDNHDNDIDETNNDDSYEIENTSEDKDHDSNKKKIKRKRNKIKVKQTNRIKTRPQKNNSENDSGCSISGKNGGKRTNQEVFICKICDKRYFKKEKFEACMRSHKGLKPWVCPECKKEYRKKASLMNHIKYEHKKNCEMYSCPVEGCNKAYRLKQTMQVHYRRIHVKDLLIKDPKKTKSYICEQCGKSLRTLNALNQHRFTHTGDFPYKCEQCPKRCGTRYQLEVHMKRHKGIKNYICSICGLKKITQQELNTHMNYHSRNKTFTCKFCPYTSCNNGNVVRHEKIVHHGIKTFECIFCNKTFGKAETLKHHVMTHTGEKPHECHLCGKRFIQPTALKTHLKRHDKNTVKTSSLLKTSIAITEVENETKSITKNLKVNIKNEKNDQCKKIEGTKNNDEICQNIAISTENIKLLENSNNVILDDETPDIIQTVEVMTTTTSITGIKIE